MRIKDANTKLLASLSDHYDKRESENVAKIFWEDLFAYRGGMDRHLHSLEMETYEIALQEIIEGKPIQYVTGLTYFYDVKLKVNKHVLIPRPETEELVDKILTDNLPAGSKMLDIGTGSGCIPIVLKRKRPDFQMVAIDLSNKALKVAKENAEKNEVQIKFWQMDFLSELAWENFALFDVIVSNPPYISHGEKALMSDSTLKFEPGMALFPSGEDVLIFYREIARFSKEHLSEGGRIYLECNEYNADAVADIFRDLGYHSVELLEDMQGKKRMLLVS